MTHKRIIYLLLALVFTTSVSMAMAQEKKEEEKSEPVKVSGKIYFQWAQQLNSQYDGLDDGSDKKHYNSFELKRAYLTAEKEISKIWSAKVTLDAGNSGTIIDSASKDAKGGAYNVFVKNAYGQAKTGIVDGVDLNLKFGIIGTPVIDLIDKVSDYRWMNSNYLDAASSLLYKDTTKSPGQSIDTSADMGASIDLKLMKMVTLSYMISNGEGFKKTLETADAGNSGADVGKAMYGMLTVNPIEGVYVAAYMRNCDTQPAKYDSRNFVSYYGFLAAYSTSLVKVGMHFDMGKANEKASTALSTDASTERNFTLYDIFINVNLDSVIQIPILVAARYASGTTEFTRGYAAPYDGKKSTVNLWAIGAGYAFNKNVRLMAYLEDSKSTTKADEGTANVQGWKSDDMRWYVKGEFVF
jgi:hypothetical protein